MVKGTESKNVARKVSTDRRKVVNKRTNPNCPEIRRIRSPKCQCGGERSEGPGTSACTHLNSVPGGYHQHVRGGRRCRGLPPVHSCRIIQITGDKNCNNQNIDQKTEIILCELLSQTLCGRIRPSRSKLKDTVCENQSGCDRDSSKTVLRKHNRLLANKQVLKTGGRSRVVSKGKFEGKKSNLAILDSVSKLDSVLEVDDSEGCSHFSEPESVLRLPHHKSRLHTHSLKSIRPKCKRKSILKSRRSFDLDLSLLNETSGSLVSNPTEETTDLLPCSYHRLDSFDYPAFLQSPLRYDSLKKPGADFPPMQKSRRDSSANCPNSNFAPYPTACTHCHTYPETEDSPYCSTSDRSDSSGAVDYESFACKGFDYVVTYVNECKLKTELSDRSQSNLSVSGVNKQTSTSDNLSVTPLNSPREGMKAIPTFLSPIFSLPDAQVTISKPISQDVNIPVSTDLQALAGPSQNNSLPEQYYLPPSPLPEEGEIPSKIPQDVSPAYKLSSTVSSLDLTINNYASSRSLQALGTRTEEQIMPEKMLAKETYSNGCSSHLATKNNKECNEIFKCNEMKADTANIPQATPAKARKELGKLQMENLFKNDDITPKDSFLNSGAIQCAPCQLMNDKISSEDLDKANSPYVNENVCHLLRTRLLDLIADNIFENALKRTESLKQMLSTSQLLSLISEMKMASSEGLIEKSDNVNEKNIVSTRGGEPENSFSNDIQKFDSSSSNQVIKKKSFSSLNLPSYKEKAKKGVQFTTNYEDAYFDEAGNSLESGLLSSFEICSYQEGNEASLNSTECIISPRERSSIMKLTPGDRAETLIIECESKIVQENDGCRLLLNEADNSVSSYCLPSDSVSTDHCSSWGQRSECYFNTCMEDSSEFSEVCQKSPENEELPQKWEPFDQKRGVSRENLPLLSPQIGHKSHSDRTKKEINVKPENRPAIQESCQPPRPGRREIRERTCTEFTKDLEADLINSIKQVLHNFCKNYQDKTDQCSASQPDEKKTSPGEVTIPSCPRMENGFFHCPQNNQEMTYCPYRTKEERMFKLPACHFWSLSRTYISRCTQTDPVCPWTYADCGKTSKNCQNFKKCTEHLKHGIKTCNSSKSILHDTSSTGDSKFLIGKGKTLTPKQSSSHSKITDMRHVHYSENVDQLKVLNSSTKKIKDCPSFETISPNCADNSLVGLCPSVKCSSNLPGQAFSGFPLTYTPIAGANVSAFNYKENVLQKPKTRIPSKQRKNSKKTPSNESLEQKVIRMKKSRSRGRKAEDPCYCCLVKSMNTLIKRNTQSSKMSKESQKKNFIYRIRFKNRPRRDQTINV